jgi:hypothetical protein
MARHGENADSRSMTSGPGNGASSGTGAGPAGSDLLSSAFPVGGPTRRSWREHALTRAAELGAFASWARSERDDDDPVADAIATSIRGHLDAARDAAEGGRVLFGPLRSNPVVERVMSNLDAAEVDVLRLAPSRWVSGQMPSILAHVRAHLSEDDPRRISVEDIASQPANEALTDVARDRVLAALRGASTQKRRDIVALENLRAILLVPLLLLTIAAFLLLAVGATNPTLIPLCFSPTAQVVCPTNEASVPGAGIEPARISAATRDVASAGDIALVELVGVVAAAVAAATALRGFPRSATAAYDFPMLLALLKLPTGALTAVLGLLLIRAQFVPGLSALDSSAQIIAWAVVLGYSQQVFTRLVDQHAQAVVEDLTASSSDTRDTHRRSSASERQ